MANEEKKLAIDVLARVDKLEKSMAKAAAVTKASTDKMEKSVATMRSRVEANMSRVGEASRAAFLGFSKGALAAVAGIVSLGAALGTAKTAMREYGDIADRSAAAGVDAEFFQSLAYQAGLAGVEVGTVAGALETYAKNAGLAADGKGKLVSTLKALNPQLLANIKAATTQEERIRLAADAIDHAKSSAEAAALATTLFGDSGTKLVGAFKGGADELDRMLAKAKEMGIVVDRDLIARADEMGQKFDTASLIIDSKIKRSMINLAPYMVQAVNFAADWADNLALVAEQFKAIEERQFVRPLQNQLADLYNKRFPLGEEINKLEAQLAVTPDWNPLKGLLTSELTDKRTQFAGMTAEADRLLTGVQQLQGLGATSASPVRTTGDAPVIPTTLASRGKQRVSDAEATLRVIQELEHEQALLGKTANQQELLNALKQAGVTAESSYGQAIAAVLGPLQAQRDALAANAEAARVFEDAASNAMGNFIDDLAEGKSLAESFGDVLKDLGRQLVSMGINGLTGSLSKALFPGIPAFAAGTRSAPGGLALVGEKGPELVNLSRGAQVIPAGPTAAALSGGGGDVNISYVINAQGSDPSVVDRLQAQLARHKAELVPTIRNEIMRRQKWGGK